MRFLPTLFLHYPVINDAAQYDDIARNLVENGSYTRDGVTPSMERPPGYPFFLAAIYTFTGHNTDAAIFFQIIISTLVIYLAYKICRFLFEEKIYSYAVALLVAVYPMFIYYNLFLYSENLAIFVFLLSVYFLFYAVKNNRLVHLLLSGFFFIAFILTKPLFIFSIIFYLGYLLYNSKVVDFARAIVCFLLPIIFIWSLWIGRNILAFNKPMPFGIGVGPVLFAGNYPPFKAVVPDDYNQIFIAAGVTSTGVSEYALDQSLKVKAIEIILANPSATAKLFFLKIYKFLFIVKDISRSTIYRQGGSSVTTSFLFKMIFGAYTLFKAAVSAVYLFGCGLIAYLLLKKKYLSSELVVISLISLYAIVFHSLLYVDERYHLPTFVLHIIIAIFSVKYLFGRKTPDKQASVML